MEYLRKFLTDLILVPDNSFSNVCRCVMIAAAVGLLGGCSSLLPSGETSTEGPWASYADAQATFDQIVPYRTTQADLKQWGLDPASNSNITVLNYSDLIRRFTLGAPSSKLKLDPGVMDCLQSRTACVGYEIDKKVIKRQRTGNALADIFNFSRKTDIIGWRFNGVILIRNGLVVHKLTGGQPLIHENEKSRNPLGPLQNGLGVK